MGDAGSISVVVTTCAQAANVKRCVTTILGGRVRPTAIIVVENRPAASPVRAALDGLDPQGVSLRYVEEVVPGLSRARNAGLAVVETDLVVFTDDDVVPDPGWLEAIALAFADPATDCVTGMIRPLSLDTPAQQLFEQMAGFSKGVDRTTHRLADHPKEPLFPFAAGHFGSGANTAIRTEVARAMGGFDPVLGTGTPSRGGEDLDLFTRLILRGGTIVYEPAAIVRHDHPANSEGVRRRAFDYGAGLGGMLTKHLLHGTARGRLMTAVPAGIHYALNPKSRKYKSRTRSYPPLLTALEFLGMTLGPLAYLTSVRRAPGATAPPAAQRPSGTFAPAAVAPVDLEQLDDDIEVGVTEAGTPYEALFALIRLHGQPLGTVEVPVVDGRVSARALRDATFAELGRSLDAHLLARGASLLDRAALDDLHARRNGHPPELDVTDAPPVSVIIPTAGRPERIDKCVESLLASNYPHFEVLFVDNAPDKPGTREAVARWSARDPRVRYVPEPLPGSSVARNRGIREARFDLLAFTDDDVAVDPDWLGWIVQPLREDETTGVACGLVMPARLDTPEQRWFEEFSGFGKGFERRAFDLTANRADERMLYPYWGGVFGSGNSMAFRRDVLLRIGGFDPALGAGSLARAGADIESFSHAILTGSRLVYEPRAVCWHDHRAHDAAVRKQTLSYGVGFTAILTKWLLRDPRLAPKILATALSSLRATLAARRPAAAAADSKMPHELERLGKQLSMSQARGTLQLQLRGYAMGPFLYARSVVWARRLKLHDVLEGRGD